MNLTVTQALESLETQSQSYRRLATACSRLDLIEKINETSRQLTGALSMVDDLNQCLESLHTSGYSAEWFDIVNEGNRFVAVTNLELPKFFGTDATKEAACEASLDETITNWLRKTGEFIQKLFQWVIKGCRFVMETIFRSSRQRKVSSFERSLGVAEQALDKVQQGYTDVKVNTETGTVSTNKSTKPASKPASAPTEDTTQSEPSAATAPAHHIVKIVDLNRINMYLGKLFGFCQTVFMSQNNNSAFGSGNVDLVAKFWSDDTIGITQDNVLAKIAVILQEHGVSTDKLVEYGYTIDSSGIKFIDVAKIPEVDTDICDKDEIAKQMSFAKSIGIVAGQVVKQMDLLTKILQKALSATQHKLQSVSNPNDSSAEYNAKRNGVARMQVVLQTIQACNSQYLKLHQTFANSAARYENEVNQWYNNK